MTFGQNPENLWWGPKLGALPLVAAPALTFTTDQGFPYLNLTGGSLPLTLTAPGLVLTFTFTPNANDRTTQLNSEGKLSLYYQSTEKLPNTTLTADQGNIVSVVTWLRMILVIPTIILCLVNIVSVVT